MKLTKPLFIIIAGLLVSLTGQLQAQVIPGPVSISGAAPSPQNFGTSNSVAYTLIGSPIDNDCEKLNPSNTIVSWGATCGSFVSATNNPATWTNVFTSAGWYTNVITCAVTFKGTDCDGTNYSVSTNACVTNVIEVMPFLNIVVSGTTNTICAANSNNVAIVGQQINLSAQTFGGTFSNFLWSVPGYAISNYDIVNGILYTSFQTTNSSVSFHWVDGGSKQVSCSAMCAGITCSTNANITVVSPTAQINAKTSSATLSILPSGVLLAFQSGSIPGITFSNTIVVPANFAGLTLWSQVCASAPVYTYTDINGVKHTSIQNGASPYGDLPSPYNTMDVSGLNPIDSPNLLITNSCIGVSASATYEMWMMFQPSGGCPVPLRAVIWNWTETANESAGQWSGSGSNSVNPSDFPTTDFPTWNSSLTNYSWNP